MHVYINVYMTVTVARNTSQWLLQRWMLSHPTCACPKLTINMSEQGVKSGQSYWWSTRITSVMLFWCFYYEVWTYLLCLTAFIADFELW